MDDGSAIQTEIDALDGDTIVQVEREINYGFGFTTSGGQTSNSDPQIPLVIASIHPEGPAAKVDKMRTGMQIVGINGRSVLGMYCRDVEAMIDGFATVELHLREHRVDWKQAIHDVKNKLVEATAAQKYTIPVAFERVEILFNFEPREDSEIQLLKGDIVHVTKRSDDGWCMGENQRSKQTGLFPGTFARRLRHHQEVVDAIYSDVEKYRRRDPLYERLYDTVEKSATSSRQDSEFDYGTALTPSSPIVHEESPYSRPSNAPVRDKSIEALYAPTPDTNATVVNGDVYAQVQKHIPEYSSPESIRDEYGYGLADSIYSTVSNGRPASLKINSGEGFYARLPEEDGSVLYATLAEAPEEQDPEAPAIPERRYDLSDMMPPTVEVEFAGTEEIDYGISNYEPLHEDTAIVTHEETLYDELPEGETQKPHSEPSASHRRSSVSGRRLSREEKKEIKAEIKRQRSEAKLRKKEEKDRKKKEKQIEKQRKATERKNSKSSTRVSQVPEESAAIENHEGAKATPKIKQPLELDVVIRMPAAAAEEHTSNLLVETDD